MEQIKEFIQKIRDKLAIMEFDDVFPLNRKVDMYNIKSVLKYSGIYVGGLIIAALIFIILGAIPYVGWLFRAVAAIVGIYGVVGLGGLLLSFMKYN